MPKEYPALMVEDSGYAAILRGHGLAAEDLQAAELAMIGKPEEGWFTEVEEAHFDYVPRVKWCSRHPLSGGWSCDMEGDWHGHWFAVRETDIEACHFTIIRHTDVDPTEVSEPTDPSFCPPLEPGDDETCTHTPTCPTDLESER
ncbi:hypothetical protein [Microbacterium sp. 4NA327F11]|uniref:hypothetical protein n=1 Tax=Microbacterium sp. 4NA327F11 TaxID=2502229 RepID=UPI0010F5D1CB|nr:hypothetical protein [Microbacterium sp. 4NA327F11]